MSWKRHGKRTTTRNKVRRLLWVEKRKRMKEFASW
jgi:hypothetical protein